MATPDHPSQAELSGDGGAPKPPPRGLKAAVIIMGVMLVVGFIVLFSAIAYRAVNPGSRPESGPGSGEDAAVRSGEAGFGTIDALIGKAARIGAMGLDGDRLAVETVGPDGSEIIMFDVRRGRELGRIRFKQN